MKRNETPDILKRFRNMKLRKELTVLLALFVMISTSYAMIHPGEALNNNVARTFMFFNEEEGMEEENGELINASELLEEERDAEAVNTEVPAEESSEPAQEETAAAEEKNTAVPQEQSTFEPTSTPAETVVPTLEPTEPAEETEEPEETPVSTALATAEPGESEETSDPLSTASAEAVLEETSTPEATASAEPEATASAEPTEAPEVTASPEPSATPEAEVKYPPFFEENIIPMEENDVPTEEDIRVTIKAPEGVFPEGTKVEVKLIRDEKILEAIEQAAVDKAKETTDAEVKVQKVQAVDITFYNEKHEEIQPRDEQKVTVTFKSGMIKEADNTTVVHVEQDDKKENIIDATAIETVDDPNKSKLVNEINEDEVVIETPKFSVYGIVGTEMITAQYIDAHGDTYNIIVAYNDEANIPKDARLEVSEITEESDQYQELYKKASQAVLEGQDKAVPFARFFDISIMDGDQVVQPAVPVDVKIEFIESVESQEGAKYNAVHFTGDEVQKIDAAAEVADANENVSVEAISFEAESFSIYGVTYSVDFTYKNFTYSIEGESSILLSELFEVLGIEDDAAETVKIEFTNYELIQIEQVESDWQITSLLPFDTEETLTVTMKDGTVYVITVKDDLVTDTITVKKTWVNDLDDRGAEAVTIDVYEDSSKAASLVLNDDNGYSNTLQITYGVISIGEDGSLAIVNAGHDYSLQEDGTNNNYYRWELQADTIHPMMIGEEKVILVKTENYPDAFDYSSISYYPTQNPEYYRIGDSIYKTSNNTNEWSAVNYRRGNLNVKKTIVGDNPKPDTLFHYHMSVYDWTQDDIWFSVMDADGNLVKDLDTDATPEEGETGYYYFDSHSTLEIGLKEGWNIRFTNLESGSAFKITEVSQMGYEFAGATANAQLSIIGSTVIGRIEEPNTEYQLNYSNRIVEDYPINSDDNIRLYKWAELTDVENEFLVHLSIDQKERSIAEFFGPGHWYADTSNDDHGATPFTISRLPNGSLDPLGDATSGYQKHTTVKVIASDGSVLMDNFELYWDHGNNITIWVKVAEDRYMLLGASVKAGVPRTVGLTTAAEEELYNYTEESETLKSVVDKMGPAVIYLDSAEGDGTVTPESASNTTGSSITWNIVPKDLDDCEKEIEIIEEGGTTTTTTWYKDVAELTYRVRLDPTAVDFVNGASVINTDGEAAFVENYYNGTNPASDYLNAANDHATLTYSTGNDVPDSYLDFPIPYIRGTTYTFNFTKEDEDTAEVLAGAEFSIVDEDHLYTNAPDGGWTATADENGVVTFTGIPFSTNLKLTETKAPENYEITFEGLTIQHLGVLDDMGDASTPTDLDYHKYHDDASSPEYEFLGVYGRITTNWTAAEDMPDQAEKWIITDKKNSQEIDLLKVDAANPNIKLDDVVFELYSNAEHTTKAKDTKGVEIGTITTADGGKAYIGRLAVGTYYLQETKTAPGYNMLEGDVVITVTSDKVTYLYGGKLESPEPVDGIYTITVSNSTGIELPNTGGSGTLPYTLDGIALIMASSLMYGFRMRRRERRLN